MILYQKINDISKVWQHIFLGHGSKNTTQLSMYISAVGKNKYLLKNSLGTSKRRAADR
jgi:hypothetical protein